MSRIVLALRLIIMIEFFVPTVSYAGQAVTIRLETPLPRTSLASGHGIGLRVTLTNNSPYPIHIMEREELDVGEASYYLYAEDATGKRLALTEYGQHIYGTSGIFVSGTYRATVLRSGRSVTKLIRAEKVYDLSQPGTYTFRVARQFNAEISLRYVQSNSVVVILAP